MASAIEIDKNSARSILIAVTPHPFARLTPFRQGSHRPLITLKYRITTNITKCTTCRLVTKGQIAIQNRCKVPVLLETDIMDIKKRM